MLLFPGLFDNEGFQIENQREYCDQLLLNGLNKYKKEYKEFEKNKKKEDISFDYCTNNPVSNEKIFVNDYYNINLDNKINKNETNYQYINDDIKNNIEDKTQYENMENKDNNIENENDKDNDNILYQPKKIKKINKYPIHKNSIKIKKDRYINNKEDFYSNNIENNNNINNDKIKGNKSYDEDKKSENKSLNNYPKKETSKTKNKTININKGNYIRKKKFINKKEFKNDISDNINNLSNDDNKDYYSYRSSNKSNKNKNNSNKNENKKNKVKVKQKINTNIKPKIRGISDEKNIDKRNNTFDLINDDKSYGKYDKTKRRKKEISNLNNIERNNSFDIINNNKSHWRNNKIEIEKMSNFKINSKDNKICNNKNNRYNNVVFISNNNNNNNNNNYYNSNIEFKSEYKKSGIYLRENNNDDFDEIKNITKSTLKDYINKEADIIKHNPNYINNQINRNKIDKLDGEFNMNLNIRREDRIINKNNNSSKNRYINLYFDNNKLESTKFNKN